MQINKFLKYLKTALGKYHKKKENITIRSYFIAFNARTESLKSFWILLTVIYSSSCRGDYFNSENLFN